IILKLFVILLFFFFSSRRRHTRSKRDWSSDVCSSDLASISYLPESVSMLPLKQDEESSSANTIACLIGKKSNQALNQLLIEYINPYAVKNIQNLVLTKKKTPLF